MRFSRTTLAKHGETCHEHKLTVLDMQHAPSIPYRRRPRGVDRIRLGTGPAAAVTATITAAEEAAVTTEMVPMPDLRLRREQSNTPLLATIPLLATSIFRAVRIDQDLDTTPEVLGISSMKGTSWWRIIKVPCFLVIFVIATETFFPVTMQLFKIGTIYFATGHPRSGLSINTCLECIKGTTLIR